MRSAANEANTTAYPALRDTLPPTLDTEIDEYERAITPSADPAATKGIRTSMGVYEQRQDGLFMLRLCIPGGDISPAQLEHAANVAEKYTAAPLHITTRQDLQIHGLGLSDTPRVMREIAVAGLSSRGGGGNTVRNVTQSWDTGIASDEVFDVVPHARAMARRMAGQPNWRDLPRKFKIAFSNGTRDTAYAMVADVGFVARLGPDGTRGFRVYAGGGMGNRSCTALLLLDFIREDQAGCVADAVRNYFHRHGGRANRHTARLRFVRFDRGDAAFRDELLDEYARLSAAGAPPFVPGPARPGDRGFVEIPLLLGDMTPTVARTIAAFARPYGEESLRLTPAQNIMIRNVPPDAVLALGQRVSEVGLPAPRRNTVRNAVVCAGASTCRLGICMSRGLVSALQRQVDDLLATHERTRDISIRVSGCPNSCGQHLLADIGFVGGATHGPGGLVPAYTLATGAVHGDGIAQLAAPGPRIPARAVPAFVRDLLLHVAQHRADGEPFHAYMLRAGRDEADRLAAIHSAAAATDPLLHVDHGSSIPFAVTRPRGGSHG